VPTAGKHSEKSVFVYAGVNARGIASVWRKSMKRVGLGIVVALGLTLPAFGQSALKEQIIGAWSLVSRNGTDSPSCAGDPNGIHILDASGHYAIVIAARGRTKFNDPTFTRSRSDFSSEEYKAATTGLVTNFGTWSVNEATVTYQIDGALFPNIEGADLKATISLFRR
jgi:hypothetical protein